MQPRFNLFNTIDMTTTTINRASRLWLETHHEVVSLITQAMVDLGDYPHLEAYYTETGYCGLYDLGIAWTDEFETLHAGKQWDGEFFDYVEAFVAAKLTSEIY